MYNFGDYIDNKNALIEKMEKAKESIAELKGMGIDVSQSIKKIDNAIQIVNNDKISIVLVGAFSDGKTSVLAGWMNEKTDDMKIASDESSDEILCYTAASLPDYCRIIDTPGLFGDKKGSDEEGRVIALSDKTKKFISEANLILYVVTAKNPVKDTHKDCIRWILKDLNMLSSTIFVINRMDDVADLTDNEDFAHQSRIKIENVRNKLLECGLSQAEAEEVRVVCISADPDGRGIDMWNQHRDEYLRRSRLNMLENVTNDILKGSRERLIAKTGCSILNDEIKQTVDVILEQEKFISEVVVPEITESLKRNQRDLDSLQKKIIRNRLDMKKALKALNNRKIDKIRAASAESFRDVMEEEIGIEEGKEFSVLCDEIKTIFIEYAGKNSEAVIATSEKFQSEYDKRDSVIETMVKSGVKGTANGLKYVGTLDIGIIKKGIFETRDLLGKLGIKIKFKPWQATKIASAVSKAVPIIGTAIDATMNIIENIGNQQQIKKFEKAKNDIKEGINEIFSNIYDEINSDEKYINDFAPEYRIVEQQVAQDKKDLEEQKLYLKKIAEWEKNFVDFDLTGI